MKIKVEVYKEFDEEGIKLEEVDNIYLGKEDE